MRSNWFPILLGALYIVLISARYILAYQDEGYRFGGFLLNPIDGNTYLAKMYQGWQGSWRFSLPFTVEQAMEATCSCFTWHSGTWLASVEQATSRCFILYV